MKLENKIVVITGASAGKGMSRGFPEGFAKEGANLVLNYYGQPQNEMIDFQKDLEKFGHKVILVEGDISREETAAYLIETAISEFGRIDVLLNNAGISKPKLLVDMNYVPYKHLRSVRQPFPMDLNDFEHWQLLSLSFVLYSLLTQRHLSFEEIPFHHR